MGGNAEIEPQAGASVTALPQGLSTDQLRKQIFEFKRRHADVVVKLGDSTMQVRVYEPTVMAYDGYMERLQVEVVQDKDQKSTTRVRGHQLSAQVWLVINCAYSLNGDQLFSGKDERFLTQQAPLDLVKTIAARALEFTQDAEEEAEKK